MVKRCCIFIKCFSLWTGLWVRLTDSLNCLHAVSHTPVRRWWTSTLSARITFYHDSWRLLRAQEIMMCEILINPDPLQAWSSHNDPSVGRWKYHQYITSYWYISQMSCFSGKSRKIKLKQYLDLNVKNRLKFRYTDTKNTYFFKCTFLKRIFLNARF